MTSAHSMQFRCAAERRRRLRLRAVSLVLCLFSCGCSTKEKLQEPHSLQSPYEHTQLWAVAPFNNESGVSIVKPDRIADLFVEQLEQVSGVRTIAVNRVLLAMHRLELRSIATSRDAVSVMNALGVDGLIVGTVTAYDPYPPPKLGAAIQLYRRESMTQTMAVDPVKITRASSEEPVAPGAVSGAGPIAQASGVYDAKNHHTLQQLDEFAAGRTEPDSAHGKRIYLMNMELYTQFVAYRLIHDLLDHEHNRLNPPPASQPIQR
jgi:hypothetical protein